MDFRTLLKALGYTSTRQDNREVSFDELRNIFNHVLQNSKDPSWYLAAVCLDLLGTNEYDTYQVKTPGVTAAQLWWIEKALLLTVPSEYELYRMIYQINLEFIEIPKGLTLAQVTRKVVQYADEHGCLGRLIEQARRYFPNALFAEILKSFGSYGNGNLPPHYAPHIRKQLERKLVEKFTYEEFKVLAELKLGIDTTEYENREYSEIAGMVIYHAVNDGTFFELASWVDWPKTEG